MTRDRLFEAPRPQIVDFRFDAQVAEVFPDMIRRSVPGYELVVPMTGLLAARHLGGFDRALAYDLGCSLGATSMAILHALRALAREPEELRIVAVDNSAAMLAQARKLVRDPRVELMEADVLHLTLAPCQVVTMNWVLQFLAPAARQPLLERIRESLGDDGMLLVAEKIHLEDPDGEAFVRAVHEDFKRANGYTELEISQKRNALEDVLVTDSVAEHVGRFHAAGFGQVRVWFQCLNWASFVVTP